MKPSHDADVLVVGGGPGGSTAATFLAQGGLRVTVVERERFPRFKVGESLIPTCMAICERMGVLERVLAHGFQVKYGATFHDQELGLESTFGFRPGRPWPAFTLDVHRAEFDQLLLEHAAAQPGVTVCQPATVEKVAFDSTAFRPPQIGTSRLPPQPPSPTQLAGGGGSRRPRLPHTLPATRRGARAPAQRPGHGGRGHRGPGRGLLRHAPAAPPVVAVGLLPGRPPHALDEPAPRRRARVPARLVRSLGGGLRNPPKCRSDSRSE